MKTELSSELVTVATFKCIGGEPWNSSGEELEPLFIGKLGGGREKGDLKKKVFDC